MKSLALSLLALAACDLGIGSDPNPNPVAVVCAPGHTRVTDDGPCMATMAASIAIDGVANDWAGVPDFTVTGGSLAVARNNEEDSDLLVRAIFDGGPLDNVLLELAPSPARPATGGNERITVDAAGVHHEKNGIAIVPEKRQVMLAWTADGFEAAVRYRWLTYQGALRMSVVGTREGIEIVRTEMLDVCFGFREGYAPLSSTACEVAR
jgi:hypothetical protein